MSWTIPFWGTGFPATVQSTLPHSFAVDEFDLLWSAATVGRPNLAAVLAYGPFALAEIVWRCSTVDANILKVHGIHGLHNSPAFNALDPTEKGWINFLFGMLFTKLAAAELLGMPWLFHFKWFQTHNPVTMQPGGSTPDFVGLDPVTLRYSILEAKGRNAGFSADVLDKAKEQALQPVRVNGQLPQMHIGSLLYRVHGERFAMAMIDPAPREGRFYDIADSRETWAQYYSVAWGLSGESGAILPDLKRTLGFTVDFDEVVRPMIAAFFRADGDEWRAARDMLIEWSAYRRPRRSTIDLESGYRTFGDGIRISLSPDRDRSLFEPRPLA